MVNNNKNNSIAINNEPLFSIIITIYNKSEYLEDCINSVLVQKFDDYEILLIDDGSTDNSLEICNKFKKQDNRIRVFHNDNHGLVWSREFGIKNSKGEFIVYLDADDYLAPEHLETCYQEINNKDDVEMIIYGFVLASDSQFEKSFFPENYWKICTETDKELWFDKYFFNGENFIKLSTGTAVIKKSLLFDHYCKDYHMTRGEDWAYSYECLYFSKCTIMLPKYLYYHRDVPISMNKNAPINFYQIFNKYNYWFKHLANNNQLIDGRLRDSLFYYLWDYIYSIENKSLKILIQEANKYKNNIHTNYKFIKDNIYDYKHLCLTDKLLINLLSMKKYKLALLIFRYKHGKYLP